MLSILQKPIFWFISLILITALFLFLTFFISNTRNKNQPSITKKPGSCLILEEQFCSQTERKPVMINNSQRTYIVFRNTSENRVPVFAAADGEFLDKVPESGAPFSGFKATVRVADGVYIVTGDLEFDNMIQVKNPKRGSVIGHVISSGTVYITKTKLTPSGLETDEAQLKRLFRLK